MKRLKRACLISVEWGSQKYLFFRGTHGNGAIRGPKLNSGPKVKRGEKLLQLFTVDN
jgi:hypothetical protein